MSDETYFDVILVSAKMNLMPSVITVMRSLMTRSRLVSRHYFQRLGLEWFCLDLWPWFWRL